MQNIKKYFIILSLLLVFTSPLYAQFTSSNLPIVKLYSSGGIKNDSWLITNMEIIWDETGGRNFVTDSVYNYNGRIAIKYHGQSSLDYNKKSYRIETQDSLGENANVSLLGLPKENDWILHAPYVDKSLMRNALAYTLAGEVVEYAPRVRFCEVLLNGYYRGVYVLTEKIKRDKNRVNIEKMSSSDLAEPEISGGYIFKRDKINPDDNVIQTTRGLDLIVIEPKVDSLAPEQTAWLLNYLNEFEDTLYSGGNYGNYIDVQSFVDNFLIVEFTKNIDGFRRSTYFYKDREGKINASLVWDYNLAFGNADFHYGWTNEGWYYPISNKSDHAYDSDESDYGYNWWLELLEDPTFHVLIAQRWKELRAIQFSESNIFSLIDEWRVLLEESQERNFAWWNVLNKFIWPNPGYPDSGTWGYPSPTSGAPTTWDGEVEYVKDFIHGRLEWMDEQFGFDPVGISTDILDKEKSFKLYSNYPNPFNPTTTIEYLIAANSTVTLSVFNSLGQEVAKLVDGENLASGNYKVNWNANDFASGVYFYKIRAGEFVQTKKLLLLK